MVNTISDLTISAYHLQIHNYRGPFQIHDQDHIQRGQKLACAQPSELSHFVT